MGETCPKRVAGGALVQWALRDAIRTCSNYKGATQVTDHRAPSLTFLAGNQGLAVDQEFGAVDFECRRPCWSKSTVDQGSNRVGVNQ